VLYDNSKSAVCGCTTGVLQGDVLAPFLFIIVLDFVINVATKSNPDGGLLTHPRRSKRNPDKKPTRIKHPESAISALQYYRFGSFSGTNDQHRQD